MLVYLFSFRKSFRKTNKNDLIARKKTNRWYYKSKQKTSCFKGALLGLRKYFPIKSPLKKMKNVFYSILKALFVLKILKFLA